MLRNPSTREYFSEPKNVQYLGYQAARTGFFTTLSLAGRVGRAVRRQVKGADAGEDIIPSQFTSGLPRFAGSAAEMLRRDLDNISKGIYRAPYDMDPTHRQASPIFVLEQLKNFVDSAIDGSDRQMRKGAFEVRDSSKNLQGYPDYYLQNFHWTGGWMSADSAKQYELGTEAVFVGLQDAMQRQILVPLHYFMQGRREGDTKLLEVGAGTGRVHTYIKDNYPTMHTTACVLPLPPTPSPNPNQDWVLGPS